MASNPGGRPSTEPHRRGSGEDASDRPAHGDRPERFGPLALARHVKEDGRTLILYSRAEDEPN